jgi:uncharacterized membrane protein
MAQADRFTHRSFQAGLIFKGVDGCLELIGATALLVTTRSEIRHGVAWLTREELAEDPTDFVAIHADSMAHQLTAGTQHFAAAYLFVHGAIKLSLVVCLLRRMRWMFPVALVVLGAFIGYQLYRIVQIPSWPLALFTFLDVVVVALIWREWRTQVGQAQPVG